MANKINLKGLAEILNLSISTVSKSLSNSPEISDSTKALVKAAAKQYRYRPNHMARGLKSKKSKTLGVIIPNISVNFFTKVLDGMEQEAAKNGYNLVTCISNESINKEKKSIDMLCDVGVDAVLISVASETQGLQKINHLKETQYYDIPLIMFDRISKQVSADSVVINDYQGAYDATQYLYKTGCRTIAFLTTLLKTTVSDERELGYEGALEAVLSKNNPIKIHTNLTDLEKDFTQSLSQHQIDGILAADELSAICIMNVLRSLGKKIPEDVAVIGFTDGMLAKNYYPPLTTISQNAEAMGKQAVRIALERIQNPEQEVSEKIIETDLIIRQSTREINN